MLDYSLFVLCSTHYIPKQSRRSLSPHALTSSFGSWRNTMNCPGLIRLEPPCGARPAAAGESFSLDFAIRISVARVFLPMGCKADLPSWIDAADHNVRSNLASSHARAER